MAKTATMPKWLRKAKVANIELGPEVSLAVAPRNFSTTQHIHKQDLAALLRSAPEFATSIQWFEESFGVVVDDLMVEAVDESVHFVGFKLTGGVRGRTV